MGESHRQRDRAGTSQPCRDGTAGQGQFPRGGATSGESGVLEVWGGLRVVLKNQETHEILGNKRISLWREDEKILETRTDSEGYFEVIGIGIGEFTVTVEEE